MKLKVGRPKLGRENKAHVSIRLEPSVRLKLIKEYGSIQQWIDHVLFSHQRTTE